MAKSFQLLQYFGQEMFFWQCLYGHLWVPKVYTTSRKPLGQTSQQLELIEVLRLLKHFVSQFQMCQSNILSKRMATKELD